MKRQMQIGFILACGVGPLLAGCGIGGNTGTLSLQSQPLDAYNVSVRQRTEIIEVEIVPGETILSEAARRQIRQFTSTYRRKGHGPITVLMPLDSVDSQLVVQLAKEARDIAWERGVDYANIIGDTYDASRDARAPLILSFETFDAIAPDCPTAAEVSFSDIYSNEVQAGFGCSIRTNIAAMVADPADLIGRRTLGQGDAGRRLVVLEAFRQGEETSAERSDEERAGVDDQIGGGGGN